MVKVAHGLVPLLGAIGLEAFAIGLQNPIPSRKTLRAISIEHLVDLYGLRFALDHNHVSLAHAIA